MLRITPEVRDELFAHAVAEAPLEMCGMLSAFDDVSVADEFHPIENAARSATRFSLDGTQMLKVEQRVDDDGRVIVAVVHSHPATSPYPSATDVNDAASYDPTGLFRHVIVSLRHAEPAMRCFRLADGAAIEEPIVVAVDTPEADDGSGKAAAAVALRPVD